MRNNYLDSIGKFISLPRIKRENNNDYSNRIKRELLTYYNNKFPTKLDLDWFVKNTFQLKRLTVESDDELINRIIIRESTLSDFNVISWFQSMCNNKSLIDKV